MRWTWVVAVLSSGCATAARPALHADRGSPGAVTEELMPGDTADPAPQPVTPGAAAAVTSTEIVAEYREVAIAIETEIPSACASVDARYALAHAEPTLLRQIRLAREQTAVDDGTSELERRARAWAIFDEAIEDARRVVRIELGPQVDETFLSRPRVVTALEKAATRLHGDVYVYPDRLAGYVKEERRNVRKAARASLDAAAAACADYVVDRERGRWVAIFNGKL